MELDAPPPAAAAAAAAATAAIPSAGSDKVSGWPRSGSGGGGRGLAPPDLMLLCLLQHKVDGEGGDAVTGHIISTTIGGKNGEPKRVSYHFSRCLSCLPASACRAVACVNPAARGYCASTGWFRLCCSGFCGRNPNLIWWLALAHGSVFRALSFSARQLEPACW
jgi:hypothetical protein